MKKEKENIIKVKENNQKNKVKNKRKKRQYWWLWPLKIFIIALFLSFSFSVLSEIIFSVVGIAISILVIVILLSIGIISDMIGVAVTSASLEPFTAMRSRKVRGAKQAMSLVKNAEKISSICNDVIGDICGILTGAAGAVIVVKLITESTGDIVRIIISASVSAIIAGFTILGKASFKKIAMDNSTKIVLIVGKCLSVFCRNKKKKNKKKKDK